MMGAGELSETKRLSSSFVTLTCFDPGVTTNECSSFVTVIGAESVSVTSRASGIGTRRALVAQRYDRLWIPVDIAKDDGAICTGCMGGILGGAKILAQIKNARVTVSIDSKCNYEFGHRCNHIAFRGLTAQASKP
jgi:hypothetical protein